MTSNPITAMLEQQRIGIEIGEREKERKRGRGCVERKVIFCGTSCFNMVKVMGLQRTKEEVKPNSFIHTEL